MDFTISIYRRLIQSFLDCGYDIVPVRVYLEKNSLEKVIVLRHDVDELPQNALRMAKVENDLGVCATYYFRRVPKSDHPDIIRQIAAMGHEIGYHYEDLSSANGDMVKAIESFSANLQYFRQYYPVKTVCMHGSSTSLYDNKAIWSRQSLSEYGLVGEPYLSFDFKKIFYLTDTGYAWDGGKYAIRDKVENPFPYSFHHTKDIIQAINNGDFPQQTLVLAHTLWTNHPFLWCFLHFREGVRNRVKLLSTRNEFVSRIYHKLVHLYWK